MRRPARRQPVTPPRQEDDCRRVGEVAALIMAAGRGVRAGGGLPKQYRPLAGVPLVRHSVLRYLAHPAVDRVRLVIQPEDHDHYQAALGDLGLAAPVAGGGERQESVRLGLEALCEAPPASVLVHDAARPMVDADTIQRVVTALGDHPGAIAAVPAMDTLKRVDAAGQVGETVDRTGIWRAQTPQGFHYAPLLAAHRRLSDRPFTDDAAVAEAAGLPVALVAGSEDNLKVTTADDFARATRLLAAPPQIRIGSGFDVHRLTGGDSVTLCGVTIPHDRALAGHSDADVGLHALTDALLGTIGEADIGAHFPPSDPQWADADSAVFLRHAHSLVAARGGAIVNADVTLICERPAIAPHRAAMRESIAALLEVDVDRVSVKATTTERLGFVGRGEGIAAQAVVSVSL